MASDKKPYPATDPNPDFAKIEESILDYWKENDTFRQSVDHRPATNADGASNEFVFNDGPPFANGLPHYGHLLTGFVKDVFPRYQTLKGKRVERRFGWDCHGLPAEMGAEKELGISGRAQIMEHGIDQFNAHCRNSVMKYAGEWEGYVTRQARWVDFENDYKTMDKNFMESVMWAFKQLYDKGLIYESYRVMPYSWAAETPLSNFETRLDNSYRERTDKAVAVAFELKERPEGAPEADKYYVLTWTTTPWTLPSNLALAAKADMDYACVTVEKSSLLEGEQASQASQEAPASRGGYSEVATDHARDMRKEPTDAENKLWHALKGKQLEGHKFRRQQPIGSYIVDFYSSEARLVIELDGGQHGEQQAYDEKRTTFLEAQGYRVLRFWNNEVLANVEGVLEVIAGALRTPPHDSSTADAALSSAPPQGGSESVCYILSREVYWQGKYSQFFDGLNPDEVLASADKKIFEFDEPIEDAQDPNINIKGAALIGLTYKPLFPYFQHHPNAFRILDGSDFIEEGEGTGIVHMAPGFGEDDQRICEAAGIDIVCPVDHAGKYTDEIYDLGIIDITPFDCIDPTSDDAQFETARLILRPFREDDYDDFKAMLLDPGVSQGIADVLTEESMRAEFDRFTADHKAWGFNQWAVIEKDTGRFIGRSGFDKRGYLDFFEECPNRIEARTALIQDAWGKGYATELMKLRLDYAFGVLGVETVVAGCGVKAKASQALFKRFGFSYRDTVDYKDRPVLTHTVNKDDYLAAIGPSLSLKGLNVVADERKNENEPYKPEQLQKYGLANLRIIDYLKQTGQLIKQDEYPHNYPHCWRTDTPLIYKAVPSWYVEVTKFRDRMVELNEQINWIPGHVKHGLFGKWLENARDWSISRNRFWGAPIPIWKSDNPDNDKFYVFGSINELEDFFKVEVKDLHRPYIDDLTAPDPDNPDYTLRRVEDVLDCWFESGSMPYAQNHVPFESEDWFNSHNPADFIVEYTAQTRGWFYTMMVLGTALFDRPPFLNCICHGVVLDAEGQKLSKRLNNYPDPHYVFDTYGADALRWFMMSSPIMRGQELYIDKEGSFIRDAVRLYIKPIWNAYNFFCLYANADGLEGELILGVLKTDNRMDHYIRAKLADCIAAVEQALDDFDTPAACEHITLFLEALNNWYIRRNKERFWKSEQDDDKQDAYNTLYTVLHILTRAVSPLLPLIAEHIYQGLTDNSQSVHLTDWPGEEVKQWKDSDAIEAMDRARDACNAALSIRNKENLRVRLPLNKLTIVASNADLLTDYVDLIKDEVNVKQVKLATNVDDYASFRLQVNLPKVGKKLGSQVPQVMKATKTGDWQQQADGSFTVGGVTLAADECDVLLDAKVSEGKAQPLASNDALVVLDTTVTLELEYEGIARDVVRLIQQARKEADLNVSDRIMLKLEVPPRVQEALSRHQEYISEQTLAAGLETGSVSGSNFANEQMLDGEPIKIGLSVAA